MNVADLPARMQSKITITESGCWHWTAAVNSHCKDPAVALHILFRPRRPLIRHGAANPSVRASGLPQGSLLMEKKYQPSDAATKPCPECRRTVAGAVADAVRDGEALCPSRLVRTAQS